VGKKLRELTKMKLKGIKSIALVGVVTLLLVALVAAFGMQGNPGLAEGQGEVALRELITGLRVWYVGCGKDNALYLGVLERMRGMGVREIKHVDVGTFIKSEALAKPQDSLLIVVDGDWVRDHVGDKGFHRLLQHIASQRVPIAAVGGETSRLMVALHEAGVNELAGDEFGNVMNPFSPNRDVVGFQMRVQTLPDGRLNWYPFMFAGRACPETPERSIVELLIERGMEEQVWQFWPRYRPLPPYLWQQIWRQK
jgi:hypothetical protein